MAKRSSPIDWDAIESEYCNSSDSIREIADRYTVSDTAIRKRAAKEGWERPVRTEVRRELERAPPAPHRSDPDKPRENAGIADDGRNLVARMLDELDAVTSRPGELEELIIEATDGDESDARRDAMMKAVSLPTRANTLKTLALSLKALSEAAAPQGKKAAAQDKADEINSRLRGIGPPTLRAVN